MKYLFPILALSFLLVQCTIEKRLYNKGYHVEWRKNAKSSQNNTESIVEDGVEETGKKDSEFVVSSPTVEQKTEEVTEVGGSTSDELITENVSENQIIIPVPKDTVHVYERVKNEPVGVAAGISLLTGALLTRLPVLALGYVGIFLFGAAFILSIISMIRFAYNRDYYETNILGVLTFILCLVLLLVVAIIIAALLVW